jgi:hypothetical protein
MHEVLPLAKAYITLASKSAARAGKAIKRSPRRGPTGVNDIGTFPLRSPAITCSRLISELGGATVARHCLQIGLLKSQINLP